jgi:hypothetical protein
MLEATAKRRVKIFALNLILVASEELPLNDQIGRFDFNDRIRNAMAP